MNRLLKTGTLLCVLAGVLTSFGQTFSIRPIGKTNQASYADHPITGFNNRGEVVGYIEEPVSGSSGLTQLSWAWLPEAAHGLPAGYSFVTPPTDRDVVDRSLVFVGIDNAGRITANLSGEGIIGSTNAPNPDLPPSAWFGSVVRWEANHLQLISRTLEPPPLVVGNILIENARASIAGGPGIAVGSTAFRQITAVGTSECSTCPGGYPRDYGPGQSREAIFDIANGGYHFMEPAAGRSFQINSINDGGKMVGTYLDENGVVRPAMWNWSGAVQEFPDAPGLSNLFPMAINNSDQVAGLFNRTNYTSNDRSLGIFLYLPQPDYGLSAGFHVITNNAYFAYVAGLNNRGQILFDHGSDSNNAASYLWSLGRMNAFSSLLPSTAGWSNITAAAINDSGFVVGYGEGPYGIANFFARPWIDIAVEPSTNRVRPGDELLVNVRLTNRLSSELNSLAMVGPLGFLPTNRAERVSGPEPAGPLVLPGGGDGVFSFRVVATNAGTVRFTAQVRGTNRNIRFTSFQAISEPVIIAEAADLLVKLKSESQRAFALKNRYFSYPSELQTISSQAQTNRPAEFVVRLRNDSLLARTLRLTAEASGASGWSNRVLLDGREVSAQLFTPAGLPFPDLAGGATRDLDVQLLPRPGTTNATDETLRLSLYSDAVPDSVMDLAVLRGLRSSIPVDIAIRKIGQNGFTSASIAAGRSDVDAPLIPANDSLLLDVQPRITSGMAADGVTPLLLSFEADPDSLAGLRRRNYRIQIDLLDGELAGATLPERLRILSGDAWISGDTFTLSADQPKGFAYITPIDSDDLKLNRQLELAARVRVLDVAAGIEVGQRTLAIRKPPVFLIHGYNTAGHWGPDVIATLGATREWGSFLQETRYGQDSFTNANRLSRIAGTDFVNTFWPLHDLVPLALDSFNTALQKLDLDWAVTRYDVVAHSQGGLLTRMLASETTNPWMPEPFRNPANFYRGRFHRVVTVGSPHNGTRLLRYLLALSHSLSGSESVHFILAFNEVLPGSIGALMVASGTGQAKFDPWGEQIRELNNPSPDALWLPDSSARFHLVRTTVNDGHAPSAAGASPSEVFLGLADAREPVIPAGSDGVVDWYSMAAQSLSQPPPANSFTVTPDLLISHSPPTFLFSSGIGQTDSPDVADHVLAALDQDPRLPPSQRQFGPFPVPALLPESERNAIDAWARRATVLGFLDQESDSAALHSLSASSAQTFTVSLPLPGGVTPSGPIAWFAEVYGPEGVTTNGVTVQSLASAPPQVQVTVAANVIGDVVLKAGFRGSDGVQYFAQPRRLVRKEPVGSALVDLNIAPAGIRLPIDAVVPMLMSGTYSDGESRILFPLTNEVTAVSDNVSVVDTSDPLHWQIRGTGTARVTVTSLGFTRTVEIEGYDPDPDSPGNVLVRLEIQQGPEALVISWPAGSPGILTATETLGAANWQPVTGTAVTAGARQQMRISPVNATRFFRLEAP